MFYRDQGTTTLLCNGRSCDAKYEWPTTDLELAQKMARQDGWISVPDRVFDFCPLHHEKGSNASA